MPAKNRQQQVALIAKYGLSWVRHHHFDNHFGRHSQQAGHPTANIHRTRRRK